MLLRRPATLPRRPPPPGRAAPALHAPLPCPSWLARKEVAAAIAATPLSTRLERSPDGRVAFTSEEEDGRWSERGRAAPDAGTAPATTASLASSSSSEEDDDDDDDDRDASAATASPFAAAEAEALTQLEWRDVCYQVARLCRTVRGARVAAGTAGLALGGTRAASADALATTAEAVSLGALAPGYWACLMGVIDIGRLLDDLEPGRVPPGEGEEEGRGTTSTSTPASSLPPPSLIVATPLGILATADTLDAAAKLADGLAPHAAAHPHIDALVAGCGVPRLAPLRATLRTAMPSGGGSRLADAACPALAAARAARTAAETAVRVAAGEWARALHAAGAAERVAVAVRRDRLCIPVLAARRGGHLPKGSVTLAASGSGATLYVEPAPLVPLNNAAAAARAGVEAAEAAVLARLSAEIGGEAPALRASLGALEALDLAAARAAHATWCSGVQPTLLSREEAATCGPARIGGLLHPLLLERALPALPDPPGVSPDGGEGEGDGTAAAAAPPALTPPRPPRGVAWLVPPSTAVVTITGPNTGGKTAALKALGLAALMARAGLFLPVEKKDGGAGAPPPECAISWFSPILADIGDAQSLDASLSTFSGSVRRAGRALDAAGPDALALLDEVGSGTDPAEGAALAGALLDALAVEAALTVATTHHASLKGDARPGRVDAAVEFDTARLVPTYRLLWGSAGASSALDVAEGLGYDARLVGAARMALASAVSSSSSGGVGLGVAALAAGIVAAGGTSSTSTAAPALPAGSTPADVRAALEAGAAADLEAATAAAGKAASERAAAEAEAADAAAELAAVEAAAAAAATSLQPSSPSALASAAKAAGRAAAAAALADLEWTLAAHARGELSDEEAAACVADTRGRAPDMRTAAARLAGARAGGWTGAGGDAGSALGASAPPGWTPAVGDTVSVTAMGGARGTVVQAGGGGRVSVRVGRATLALGPGDALPVSAADAAAKPRAKAVAATPSDSSSKKARTPAPGPAVRTPSNTLDLCGMPAASAASEVADFLGRTGDDGDALFIVHGVGPLRGAVRAALEGARGLTSVGDAPGGDPGVTMVRVGKR